MAKLDFTEALNSVAKEFRWPQPGDSLFPSSSQGVLIEFDDRMRDSAMRAGYLAAADRLVDAALGNQLEGEVLVYPALYLYRHFIELSLKGLIATYGQYCEPKVAPDRRSHSILRLWMKLRGVSTELANGEEDPSAGVLNEMFEEFDKLDPGSFAFRYATDQNGKMNDLRHDFVDLGRLKEVMRGLATYFDGVDGYLHNITDYIRQYEAEEAAAYRAAMLEAGYGGW
jgi:hypothetical protein